MDALSQGDGPTLDEGPTVEEAKAAALAFDHVVDPTAADLPTDVRDGATDTDDDA
mgnify:CR=1 FL=1